jgi:hypothetical protein
MNESMNQIQLVAMDLNPTYAEFFLTARMKKQGKVYVSYV